MHNHNQVTQLWRADLCTRKPKSITMTTTVTKNNIKHVGFFYKLAKLVGWLAALLTVGELNSCCCIEMHSGKQVAWLVLSVFHVNKCGCNYNGSYSCYNPPLPLWCWRCVFFPTCLGSFVSFLEENRTRWDRFHTRTVSHNVQYNLVNKQNTGEHKLGFIQE